MAYRKYEIDGTEWTPLQDVCEVSGRYFSVVTKYLEKSGGTSKLIQPAPYQRKLMMMKSNDVPALLDLLRGVPSLGPRRRRRSAAQAPAAPMAPENGVESKQAPTADTAKTSVEFINTLRKLKTLAEPLGISLDELVFTKTGEAHFPRLKLEVVKL